jgi:hypothetical protein
MGQPPPHTHTHTSHMDSEAKSHSIALDMQNSLTSKATSFETVLSLFPAYRYMFGAQFE